MKSCNEVREALSARLDQQVTAAESAAVDAHLVVCVRCVGAERALRALRTGLRALPGLNAPDALRDRVLRVAEGATVGGFAREATAFRRPRFPGAFRWLVPSVWPRPVFAAVLILFVAGLVAGGLALRPSAGITRASELAADHQAHLDHAEGYSIASSDPAAVGAFFRARVPACARFRIVPEVNGSLVGGRLWGVCGCGAAHLAYGGRQGRPLSVFVLDARGAQSGWGRTVMQDGRAFQVANCHGCWTVSWQGGDVRCAVLCASSREDALSEADRIRARLAASV